MNKRSIILIAIVSFIVGCERDSNRSASEISQSEGNASNVRVCEITNQTGKVAVIIDGRVITRQKICQNGKSELQLAMNKVRKTKVGKGEFAMFRRYCRTAVNREIGRAAVEKYVQENNLKLSKDDILKQSDIFVKKYGVKSKKLKRWHTIDDLKYMLGKNSSLIDEDILAMARYNVMTNHLCQSDPIVITDQMISNRISNIISQNSEISLTNALIFARATNVWQKVVAKELTFEEAATNYSEDAYISDGCEWGCFSREQLEGEDALLERLPELKTGDITPPIESDGGLAIVRKDEDDDTRTYSFSRIFFRLPFFYEMETPDEARMIMANELMNQKIQNTIREYAGKLRIEYPNGTNAVGDVTFADLK